MPTPRYLFLRWLALLLTLGAARARSLLYTGERFGTLDLFALEQGAERPLLRSDDRAEFDPGPSPDGEPIGYAGPYLGLSWSPDAEHYAVTILLEDGSAAFFYDREHTFLGSYELPGLATSLDWLDDERIVLEVAAADGYAIVTMDLSGRTEELVPASGGGGLSRLGR